jgi:hypothetical protein
LHGKTLPTENWLRIDSEASIVEFLRTTNDLHDSCITSIEFTGGGFIDDSGAVYCGRGDQASVILTFDRQSGNRSCAKYVLSFTGVSSFDFNHDAADDGCIRRCTNSPTAGSVQLTCNPSFEPAVPAVNAKAMQYRTTQSCRDTRTRASRRAVPAR